MQKNENRFVLGIILPWGRYYVKYHNSFLPRAECTTFRLSNILSCTQIAGSAVLP